LQFKKAGIQNDAFERVLRIKIKKDEKTTIYMRLVGLVFIFIGIILNFQMFIYEEHSQFISCIVFLGVLLMGSYLMKPKPF
jgi:hypothetical protein